MVKSEKLPSELASTVAENGVQVAASATPTNQVLFVAVWLILVAVTFPAPATAPGSPVIVT